MMTSLFIHKNSKKQPFVQMNIKTNSKKKSLNLEIESLVVYSIWLWTFEKNDYIEADGSIISVVRSSTSIWENIYPKSLRLCFSIKHSVKVNKSSNNIATLQAIVLP